MGISSFNQPHSGMRQLKIEAEFIHIDLKFMSIRISVVKQNNQILPQLFFYLESFILQGKTGRQYQFRTATTHRFFYKENDVWHDLPAELCYKLAGSNIFGYPSSFSSAIRAVGERF